MSQSLSDFLAKTRRKARHASVTNVERVGGKWLFGPAKRFSLYALRSRFGGLSWIIQDAERLDDLGLLEIVGQPDDDDAAILADVERLLAAHPDTAWEN